MPGQQHRSQHLFGAEQMMQIAANMARARRAVAVGVERAAIIGIRMATVRLALMSLCQIHNGEPPEKEVIRAIQSLSRFLDHLGSADFSLQIYGETGWLKSGRLRGLLGD